MASQKNKRWIFPIVFLMLLALVVFRLIYPDDSSINPSFFRDNPDFYYKKDAKGLLICRSEYFDGQELQELLDSPEKPFLLKKRWIKDSDLTSIITWRLGDKKYVIKRYNANCLLHFIKQIIPYSSSMALRSFYYSYLFDKMNINTAKAIAIYEKRLGPFHSTSYQIMEQIQGVKGHDFFDNPKASSDNYEKSIKETLEITKQLEKANLIHGNLHLGHLFYVEGTPYLIDLDRVRHYRSKRMFKRQRRRKDMRALVEDVQEKLNNPEQEVFAKYFEEHLPFNKETGMLTPE